MGIKVNVKLDAYQKGVPALIPLPGNDDAYKILVVNDNSNYVLSDDLINVKNKLSTIETGALVNIIETIKMAGTELPVDQNKVVNIPKASNDSLGVVKGTVEENYCEVDDTGRLIVSSLNIDKLILHDRAILECN